MRYTRVEYYADGRVHERGMETIREARKTARQVLNTDRRVSYIIIRKYGVPFEAAHRVYNMKRNSTRVDITKV